MAAVISTTSTQPLHVCWHWHTAGTPPVTDRVSLGGRSAVTSGAQALCIRRLSYPIINWSHMPWCFLQGRLQILPFSLFILLGKFQNQMPLLWKGLIAVESNVCPTSLSQSPPSCSADSLPVTHLQVMGGGEPHLSCSCLHIPLSASPLEDGIRELC